HVYPGIRQLVIAATLRHAPQAWLRNPGERIGAALQRPFAGKAIGSSIHALGFARALARAGLAANASFAGHYDFAGDYAALLPRFFGAASARHLVMCHPGSGMADDDPIAAARIVEAKVLAEMPLSERLAQLGLEVDQPYTSRAAELSSSAK
ncbi:MAG: hypothetical protein JF593_14410, partial [Novosphingobium sp.]|nr:hypothetical protein [Novosphingobium sp.]